MIDRLNHVAIAVPDLGRAVETCRNAFGATVSEPKPMPEHGVTVAFVELTNTRIELMEPLGNSSPIADFLKRNPSGGIHHICCETPDIAEAAQQAGRHGRILGDGKPKIGAHGKPVLFLHPRDFLGTLFEFEES